MGVLIMTSDLHTKADTVSVQVVRVVPDEVEY